jgi:hypothetical protein
VTTEELIAQAKEVMRDIRATPGIDPEYKRKLLAAQRAQIARLRKPEPNPALIADVCNALNLSLRDHADIPPFALRNAARRVVDAVINGQRRQAVQTRHAKQPPNGKADQLRAAYASGRYPTIEKCVMTVGVDLGMSPDAGRRALRNQPKPTSRKKHLRVTA